MLFVSPKRILSENNEAFLQNHSAESSSTHPEFFLYKHNVIYPWILHVCSKRQGRLHVKDIPDELLVFVALTFEGIQLLCQILLIAVLLILHEFLRRKKKK